MVETGILTSSSDYHIYLKLRKTRGQAMQGYLDVVNTALDQNIIPRCHFEDVTRADYEGFVLPFTGQLLKLSQEYNKPVKIRLCDTLGLNIPGNYPLVGKSFNVTRAGIHADGLLKNEEIYNCFDTKKILNRPVGVAITDKTGAAGVKHYIEARYQIEIAKHDARVVMIKDKIDAEYKADRVSAISDNEMTGWIEEAFGEGLPPLR